MLEPAQLKLPARAHGFELVVPVAPVAEPGVDDAEGRFPGVSVEREFHRQLLRRTRKRFAVHVEGRPVLDKPQTTLWLPRVNL